MDGAVDLLVEEDVAREARDARVAAEPELAEPLRAGVGREHLPQELLALVRGRLDDLARRGRRAARRRRRGRGRRPGTRRT